MMSPPAWSKWVAHSVASGDGDGDDEQPTRDRMPVLCDPHSVDLSAEAEHFFRCHDTAHVVFRCGSTLDDEAAVKIASIFGTTAGFDVLKGYRLQSCNGLAMRKLV